MRHKFSKIALFLIGLLVVNFISSKVFIRIDLTEDNRYTLSTSTKSIVKNVDDFLLSGGRKIQGEFFNRLDSQGNFPVVTGQYNKRTAI